MEKTIHHLLKVINNTTSWEELNLTQAIIEQDIKAQSRGYYLVLLAHNARVLSKLQNASDRLFTEFSLMPYEPYQMKKNWVSEDLRNLERALSAIVVTNAHQLISQSLQELLSLIGKYDIYVNVLVINMRRISKLNEFEAIAYSEFAKLLSPKNFKIQFIGDSRYSGPTLEIACEAINSFLKNHVEDFEKRRDEHIFSNRYNRLLEITRKRHRKLSAQYEELREDIQYLKEETLAVELVAISFVNQWIRKIFDSIGQKIKGEFKLDLTAQEILEAPEAEGQPMKEKIIDILKSILGRIIEKEKTSFADESKLKDLHNILLHWIERLVSEVAKVNGTKKQRIQVPNLEELSCMLDEPYFMCLEQWNTVLTNLIDLDDSFVKKLEEAFKKIAVFADEAINSFQANEDRTPYSDELFDESDINSLDLNSEESPGQSRVEKISELISKFVNESNRVYLERELSKLAKKMLSIDDDQYKESSKPILEAVSSMIWNLHQQALVSLFAKNQTLEDQLREVQKLKEEIRSH